MPTTLVVRFPWGRYHATPWGRHVNEGQVEFPPSPWRLLRALYAVWQTRAPELPEEDVVVLLARLSEPPTYLVPPHQTSHTRHYYPDTKHRSGTPSTDRTFDSFVACERGAELGIRWPFDLPGAAAKALERLAESLPYLGRADSICEARVDSDWTPSVTHQVLGPIDIGESLPSHVDIVSLLCPVLPLAVAQLLARPVDVRAGRLLFPPGSRFVAYQKPEEVHPTRRVVRATTPVEVLRFTIVDTVLPRSQELVAVTERLRRAALSQLGKLRPDPETSLLAGKDANGPMRAGHRHAHFLGLSIDPDQAGERIDELVIWTPAKLTGDEAQAAAALRVLVGHERAVGPARVGLRLSSLGRARAVIPELVGPSPVWTSHTPFVPPRHGRGDWAAFIDREVRRELVSRGQPEPVSVEITEHLDWRPYLRYRPIKDGPQRSSSPPAAGIFVTFAEDVVGPLVLGALSHYGMGLLLPTET